jgi:hypothetical protein
MTKLAAVYNFGALETLAYICSFLPVQVMLLVKYSDRKGILSSTELTWSRFSIMRDRESFKICLNKYVFIFGDIMLEDGCLPCSSTM